MDTWSKYISTTQGVTMLVCAPVGLALILFIMSRGGDEH